MKHCAFYQNTACEYFPCHEGVEGEKFNCLFCYCPLYTLGKRCGGNFFYTDEGIKDCSNCSFPHAEGSCERMLERYSEILEVVRNSDAQMG